MKTSSLIFVIIFSLFSFSSIAEITTRSDVYIYQDLMDMNLTKRHHIANFQDLSDYNLTKRSHIEFFQDISDYNVTKRMHISSIQSYVAENCDVKWSKGCLIYKN